MEKCRRMKVEQCMSKTWIYSWLWKFSKNTPAVLSLGKLCDGNGNSYEWINGQKPHLIKNGIWIPFHTENFVLIVVPGLSSSSSSTSRTLSRQESHCSSSSSSSSSSPTEGEIQTRERGDQNESDISPVHVSTTVGDRSGRPDDNQANKIPKQIKRIQEGTERLVVFWDLGVAARIQGNFGGWWNSSSWRLSRQFFSWTILEPTPTRSVDFGKHSV